MRFRFATLLAGLALAAATTPLSANAWRHHRRPAARPALHGAYHIRPFNQAEAEAEVHTQYRYRTPYLPYWVFP